MKPPIRYEFQNVDADHDPHTGSLNLLFVNEDGLSVEIVLHRQGSLLLQRRLADIFPDQTGSAQ